MIGHNEVDKAIPMLERARDMFPEYGGDDSPYALLAIAYERKGDLQKQADALRVQAMVATRQAHWSEAAQALEEGLTLARRMPCPYAEARLLHVYGQMHAQKGELGPARERLQAALAIFRRLGARKDAERAEQAIGALCHG